VDNPVVGMAAALCVAVAVLVAMSSGHRRRRHRKQVQQWADDNGRRFTPQPAVE
jgi:hypothetical protein